jgi:hypothetical protein
LFAERPTTPYEPETTAATLAALTRTVGASYLVNANLEDEQFASDRTTIARLIAEHPERFTRIFGNARFTLYRLH